jgi:hypothetical protein
VGLFSVNAPAVWAATVDLLQNKMYFFLMEDLIQVMDFVFIFTGRIALTHTVHVAPFSSVFGGHVSRLFSTS